mgnify:CR=1 FL=1|jgi:hypothetical protein|tara:strand:- start:477 stop:737 length:261 start_codon:yes stop_codon:yes gene_type:complete
MTESQFSTILKDFKSLESSMVNRIVLREDYIEIQFTTSSVVYKYQRNVDTFDNNLQKVIDSKESVGKFLNNSIKQEELTLIDKIVP